MIDRRLSHYRIVAPLGAGAMGEVWRAYDEHLRREVAIKLLPPGTFADEARHRFRREALALSRLMHPHIVTVFDFDSEDGTDFLVMELVPGESLAARIGRGPLGLDDLVRLGRQIAAALEAAHAHGVIHRDFKPGNIMVTPQGEAKVLDFGLAKRLASEGDQTITAFTEGGTTFGTLGYMAPETLLGHEATPAVDLWALGVVLYEMATGRRPFAHPATGAFVHAVLSEEPTAPCSLRPELPDWLEALMLACLAKDPGARYSSRMVREALESAGAPVAPAPDPAQDPARAAAGARGRAASAGPPTQRSATGAGAPRTARHGARTAILISASALVLAVGFVAIRQWLPLHAGIHSLAVLPLENLSRDSDQQYFADGMTDEIITTLAKIGALRVISRSSVAMYRGTRKSVQQIARELGVDALVEGSVLRVGDQVRINARLVRASNGQDLWDERYERTLENILALQSDVASAIARQIQITVTPEERARLATVRRVNPRAYEAYLRGRQAWDQGEIEGFKRALAFFQQAVELDPEYAPAYAGIADCYWALSNVTMEPHEAMPRARAAALKALALDETLAEAHASLGTIKAEYDWDWQGAERELRRAIELKPGDAAAHLQYSFYLRWTGQFERDREELQKAIALDPLSGFTASQAGWPEFFARRYDEALAAFQRTLKTFPTQFFVLGGVAMAYEAKRDYPRAIATFKESYRVLPIAQMQAFLAHAYAVGGETTRARAILDTLVRNRRTEFVSAADIAIAFTGFGERDSALTWLERAVEEHSGWLEFIKVDPRYDPLRSEPRFQAVERRVGLLP